MYHTNTKTHHNMYVQLGSWSGLYSLKTSQTKTIHQIKLASHRLDKTKHLPQNNKQGLTLKHLNINILKTTQKHFKNHSKKRFHIGSQPLGFPAVPLRPPDRLERLLMPGDVAVAAKPTAKPPAGAWGAGGPWPRGDEARRMVRWVELAVPLAC